MEEVKAFPEVHDVPVTCIAAPLRDKDYCEGAKCIPFQRMLIASFLGTRGYDADDPTGRRRVSKENRFLQKVPYSRRNSFLLSRMKSRTDVIKICTWCEREILERLGGVFPTCCETNLVLPCHHV